MIFSQGEIYSANTRVREEPVEVSHLGWCRGGVGDGHHQKLREEFGVQDVRRRFWRAESTVLVVLIKN